MTAMSDKCVTVEMCSKSDQGLLQLNHCQLLPDNQVQRPKMSSIAIYDVNMFQVVTTGSTHGA